jgi:site-specific DNA-cytosine methylase
MNILSCFDGMSVAQQALKELGIKVDKYYASEIDKYAIAVTQSNFPNTIQLGSITESDSWQLPSIDILVGGSPCQDLSIAKQNREGLGGSRSGLFWDFVNLRDRIKPKYFILENVASMPKEAKETISRAVGCEPVMINASLVSAQNRKRLFWVCSLQEDGTYKQVDIPQPEDKHIYLDSILIDGISDRDKSLCIDASYYKGGDLDNYLSKGRRQIVFQPTGQRIYSSEGKSVSLSANGGGLGAKTGLYRVASRTRDGGKRFEYGDDNKANALTSVQTDSMVAFRREVILGEEPLQVLKEGRTEIGKLSRKEIKELTGKDSTRRGDGHKAYFGRKGDKSNCLTTGLGAEGCVALAIDTYNYNNIVPNNKAKTLGTNPQCSTAVAGQAIVKNFIIRKLHPIECLRLQSMPECDIIESIWHHIIKNLHTNKTDVVVATSNGKHQKLVSSAEAINVNTPVKYVIKNLITNEVLKEFIVQQSVDIQIQNTGKIYNQSTQIEWNLNVMDVEKSLLNKEVKSEEDFAHLLASINIIEAKIILTGLEVLHLKDNNFYTTKKWKQAVRQVWSRDKSLCSKCGIHDKESRYTHHIHHVKPFAIKKDDRANPDNLILLCFKCHRWAHSKENTARQFLDLSDKQ